MCLQTYGALLRPTRPLFTATACATGVTAVVFCAAAAAAPAAGRETWAYRIERGDTLIGLHARFIRPEARWQNLQKFNRIADPRRLRPGSLLQFPLALLRGEPVGAETLHVHGQVEVESRGGGRAALTAASQLREGDVVSTGAQSSVSLRFVDGSTLLLGPVARLRIERHVRLAPDGPADTRLRLDAGAVETRVVPARPAPRFELRTPLVSLGVRGTDFRGRVSGDRVLAEVLSGRVAVGSQAVDAGFGTVASALGIEPQRLLPATPELATEPLLLERLPLRLEFKPVPEAAAYRAQVFSTQGQERLWLDSLFTAPVAQWSEDLPDGRYELRVRAAASSGVEGRVARQVFTLKARPAAPFQLTPRAGDRRSQGSVEFTWARHPEALHYKLQVAVTPDFQTPLLDRSDLGDHSFGLLLPAGNYYWRVATVRAGNDSGPWSDAAAFAVDAPAPPPPPQPPSAPAAQPPQATDAGLVLRWAESAELGVRYQVQVARDAAFTQLLLDDTTALTERVLAAPGPGIYHVRVRSLSADGRPGNFGTAQTVEVSRDLRWLWLIPLLLLL